MPVLVDSNVILDIASDDPKWGAWSDAQVTKHHRRGLVINPIIFAELCAGAEKMTEVEGVVSELKLECRELPREALFLAAKAFLHRMFLNKPQAFSRVTLHLRACYAVILKFFLCGYFCTMSFDDHW